MPHATATYNGKTLAKADTWEVVEGNIYFPPSSVDQSVLTKTDTSTVCGWKGTASYYTLNVDGQELKDAAWYYAEPKAAAKDIKDHVAFYKSMVKTEISEN
ncbi:MAG: hypothetical protein FRX48_03601 [Lasallia pustulata]|uniref:DUF427 domain-containing protein n=1 Tax=Lasallia pustulata TaxID=136370 RepID=A0A5M8PU85_9LECA|nr:MAG: hypothetical protein FRX48_03601 [Lasallia pustulata]